MLGGCFLLLFYFILFSLLLTITGGKDGGREGSVREREIGSKWCFLWCASVDWEILENNCPVENLLHGLMSGNLTLEEWGVCIMSHAQFISEYLKLWLINDFIPFSCKIELRKFVIYTEIQKFKYWVWQIWSIFLTNKGEKYHWFFLLQTPWNLLFEDLLYDWKMIKLPLCLILLYLLFLTLCCIKQQW